jgi:hypothetical protein
MKAKNSINCLQGLVNNADKYDFNVKEDENVIQVKLKRKDNR